MDLKCVQGNTDMMVWVWEMIRKTEESMCAQVSSLSILLGANY